MKHTLFPKWSLIPRRFLTYPLNRIRNFYIPKTNNYFKSYFLLRSFFYFVWQNFTELQANSGSKKNYVCGNKFTDN